MRRLKWALIAVISLVVFGFFEYTLPQHDVVRITGTEVIRQDFSGWNRIFYARQNSGSVPLANRDLRLINAAFPDGTVMVYRNEDTGWGWPPYFKFDTSNLQAQAADLVSTRAAPQWAVVTHYGWRSELLTIYPNAINVRLVSDPNVSIIPWFNIIFFIILALLLLGLYRLLQRFKRRRIDPVIEEFGDAWDAVEDQAEAAGERASGLLGRLVGLFKKR